MDTTLTGYPGQDWTGNALILTIHGHTSDTGAITRLSICRNSWSNPHNFHPGKLDELLTRKIFVYANVPYRIKTIDQIIKDPKNTILFDAGLNSRIEDLTAKKGSDGKLLTLKTGEIYRVNLMEKILCSLLSKLSNFIPEAGIWLNTQRPEWNDANNALVGNGASMVTLCYLRRSLGFWEKILDGTAIDKI
ncbi:MAG: hypothetical protein MZV63_01735 [Marinilabiliales bacterium]|nr:hypothetical protein [Marinilabiliales bacterium]